MANLQGYSTGSVGNMINHYTRHHGDPDQSRYTYANQNIDVERTALNYALFERPDPEGFVRAWVARADAKPKSGTNLLSDWVVTMPKNDQLLGREREFFEQAYAFLVGEVDEKRVVGAWVHMDENQPHMHFAFVPVCQTGRTENDKTRPLVWTREDQEANPAHVAGTQKLDSKGTPRWERKPLLDEQGNQIMRNTFSQSKMFDRERMKGFHSKFEREMKRHFGFAVGIQLDDLGEKQLSRLNQVEYRAAKDRLAELRVEQETEQRRLEYLQRQRSQAEGRVAELEGEVERERAELADAPPAHEETLGESRSRASAIERGNDRARSRIEELKAVVGNLRARLDSAVKRIEAALAEFAEKGRALPKWWRERTEGRDSSRPEAPEGHRESDHSSISLMDESEGARAASEALRRDGGSGHESRER